MAFNSSMDSGANGTLLVCPGGYASLKQGPIHQGDGHWDRCALLSNR